MDKPQIVVHSEKSLGYSAYDGKWIPRSAKFVVVGVKPRGNGVIQLYELFGEGTEIIKEHETESAIKCSSFGASPIRDRHLATGDFSGRLQIWDLEYLSEPIYEASAHGKMINAMDGLGGQSVGCGPPEIATGSRDGTVKLWDPRQRDTPVAVVEPVRSQQARDCWTVALGNSYNNTERVICAGYDNGDIKLFDLKKMALRWETNVKNGVCSVQFDRREIEMNKLVATTLEGRFFVYDLRTQHPKKGFSCLKEKAHNSTIWAVSHLPQNRETFMTCGGGGSVSLWQYNYPDKRSRTDSDGSEVGVTGQVNLLQSCALSSQPVGSFDWCQDKTGLALITSFDQMFRVVVVTKLNTL